MGFFRKQRAAIDLWIAIAITISLSVYHLWANLGDRLPITITAGAAGMFMRVLGQFLYFWTMGLVWFAFRKWRQARSRAEGVAAILASNCPEAMLVISPDRKIVRCNEAVRRIFGYDPEELIGRTTEVLYGDRRRPPGKGSDIKSTLENQGFHIGEGVGLTKSGQRIPIQIITATFKNQNGAVLTIQDITERQDNERRLRETMTSALEEKDHSLATLKSVETNLNQLKTSETARESLVQMIVHDMRTPLQALTLCTDLLRSDSESVLTQEDRATLDMMMSYVRKLDVMTRSILDVGRMEEGRMPLRKATNPVVVVAREAVNFVTPIAGDKVVKVQASDQTLSNSFDHDIIHRVLVNLLVNAIKYSPARGEIVVEVERRGGDTHVGVSDQGPGVPAEFSSKIFEKFESINNSTHHRKDSTGVGLAFCQMAVSRHGGQIGVLSRAGGGSTFWFTLPDQAAPAEPVDKRDPVTA